VTGKAGLEFGEESFAFATRVAGAPALVPVPRRGAGITTAVAAMTLEQPAAESSEMFVPCAAVGTGITSAGGNG
jgi:hypothetical protein